MVLFDIIASICMLSGASVMMLSALGLLRFGDVFLRMHAATKSGTMGIGFILIGAALHFRDPLIAIKLIALAAIYFFTAPIGAQMLAHGAHIAGIRAVKETWIDELARDQHGLSKPEN